MATSQRGAAPSQSRDTLRLVDISALPKMIVIEKGATVIPAGSNPANGDIIVRKV